MGLDIYIEATQPHKTVSESLDLQCKLLKSGKWEEMSPNERPCIELGHWKGAGEIASWFEDRLGAVDPHGFVRLEKQDLRDLHTACLATLIEGQQGGWEFHSLATYSETVESWDVGRYFLQLCQAAHACLHALDEIDWETQSVYLIVTC